MDTPLKVSVVISVATVIFLGWAAVDAVASLPKATASAPTHIQECWDKPLVPNDKILEVQQLMEALLK